jgi:tetratricopeptide (TPR) repeat protein
MTEKVAEARENIFSFARMHGAGPTEYVMSKAASLKGSMRLNEMASEVPEVKKVMENIQKPVVADFGGWKGELLSFLEKKYPGKEITFINLDYNPAGTRGSRKQGILADFTQAPLKDASVDVVYVNNYRSDLTTLMGFISEYPLSREEAASGFVERKGLLKTLENMGQVQEDMVRLESVRLLKIGGVLVEGGGYDEKKEKRSSKMSDPSRTGALEKRSMNVERIHGKREEGDVAVSAYEKVKDVDISQMFADQREQLSTLADALDGYDYRGSFLDRAIKDSKQQIAEKLLRKRKAEDAVALFEEVIGRDGNYAKAWLGKAEALNALMRHHEMTIAMMRASRKVPDEKFSSELSRREKEMSSAAVSAVECYNEAVRILESWKDNSGIKNPNKIIQECKDKCSTIFVSRDL